MNFSSGGVAIAIIAAIWFLVFLPSFIKKESKTSTLKAAAPTVRDQVSTKLGLQASRAIKARNGRNVLISLALVSLATAILAALELATSGTGAIILAGASAATLAISALAIRNNKNYKLLLQGSLRRNIVFTRPTSQVIEQKPEVRVGTWQPESLPKQTFLRTGAIDIVELAEVIELEVKPGPVELPELDEILRRRRHIG